MMRRVIVAACCAAWILGAPVVAQAPGPNPPARPAQVWGQPNISGIWSSTWANPDVRAERARNGTNRFQDEDGGMIEFDHPDYTPEYEAKWQEFRKAYREASTIEGAGAAAANSLAVRRQAECIPYGMPRMMGFNASIDIIQAENRILIVGEIEREIRRIWLDREQLPLDEVDLGFFGRSVGEWEGDVLVVNTIGIRADLEGQDFMPHSEEMVITERISLQSPDRLRIEVTITDPHALKSPWTFTYVRARLPNDYEPSEFVCDNNRFRIGPNGNVYAE